MHRSIDLHSHHCRLYLCLSPISVGHFLSITFFFCFLAVKLHIFLLPYISLWKTVAGALFHIPPCLSRTYSLYLLLVYCLSYSFFLWCYCGCRCASILCLAFTNPAHIRLHHWPFPFWYSICTTPEMRDGKTVCYTHNTHTRAQIKYLYKYASKVMLCCVLSQSNYLSPA